MFTDPVLLASWEGLGSTREGSKMGVPVPHIPYYSDVTVTFSYPSAPGIIDSGCQHGFVCARAPENSLRNRLDRDSTSREFLGPSNFSVISPSYPESPYYCILIVCRMYGEILARMRVRADNPVRCTGVPVDSTGLVTPQNSTVGAWVGLSVIQPSQQFGLPVNLHNS